MDIKQFIKSKLIQKLGYRQAHGLMHFPRILWNKIAALKNHAFFTFYKALGFNSSNRIFLIAQDISPDELDDINMRLDFYAPQLHRQSNLTVQPDISFRSMWSSNPILVFGNGAALSKHLKSIRPGIFDVDYRCNPLDGWEWHKFARFCSPAEHDIPAARQRFRWYIDSLRSSGFQKTYILGTGPSLENALERDWSDGYRIVCNTIVRDPQLWKHIDPHFIAAGDAIYHFGHTSFARAFRRDLACRLGETSAYFVYPEIFHEIVSREFSSFAERLIPVPPSSYQLVHYDMYKNFVLSGVGNVLALLLMPLACTLSKDVYLWGFDGRAPDDKLFWANSSKHSYPEFLPELQKAHPAFFNHFVPSDDPAKYVNQVHGDILEDMLLAAEVDGWSFVMMHKNWTPTLQKRYRGM